MDERTVRSNGHADFNRYTYVAEQPGRLPAGADAAITARCSCCTLLLASAAGERHSVKVPHQKPAQHRGISVLGLRYKRTFVRVCLSDSSILSGWAFSVC